MTETYPNLHPPGSCGQPSDGLKPRKGCLFIATDVPGPPFLFFGGAAFEKSIAAEVPSSNHVLRTEMLHAPRRRKTKRKGTICVFAYKQATPPGFVVQATSKLTSYKAVKGVGNDKRFSVGSSPALKRGAILNCPSGTKTCRQALLSFRMALRPAACLIRRLILPLHPFFLVAALALCTTPAPAQEPPPSEFQLKAAFIYNFAKFVEWPANAFPAPDAPFIIGIIGDNPFDETLSQTIQNKQINGHPFRVAQFKSLAEVRHCHILFIGLSERKRLAEILRAVRGSSVLTVSDLEHFLTAGGMINFMMEGNKVRFAISDPTAKEAGLRISSKLLNLAKRPEREGKP